MNNIPDTWQIIMFAEALEVLETGLRPRGGVSGYNNGIPSLGGEHINADGTINTTNVKFIPELFADRLTRGLILPHDILIVKDGATTGKVAYVNDNFPFERSFVNEHVFKCSLYENIGYPKYFFWFFYSSQGKTEILKNFHGAAQGGITRSFADNVRVPLPPLPEQQFIVSTLDYNFEQVKKAQKKIENTRAYIRRLRQSIINNSASGSLTKRWRERNNSEEWQLIKLSDLISERPRNGYSPKPVDFETDVKSLTLAATTSGSFNPSHYKYINEPIDTASYLWLQPEDILIQRGNTIEYVGVSAIYEGAPNRYIYPDLMIKIRANERVLSKFLYYCLSSDAVRQYFRDNATGVSGSMPKINQQVLLNTLIRIPSITEQREIISRVDSLFVMLEDIQVKCDRAIQQVENSLNEILARAFSGQLSRSWRTKNPAQRPVDKRTKVLRGSNLPLFRKDVKKQKEELNLTMNHNGIKPVLEVLRDIETPVSAQQLLKHAGYASDSSTEDIEKFFIDVRTNLNANLISRTRVGNEDYFQIILNNEN